MSTSITPPTYPQNFIIKGDLDVFAGLNVTDLGDGTVYIRNGGLFVGGLTDLNDTTINTTSGKGFNVDGAGAVSIGVTAPISLATTGLNNTIDINSGDQLSLTSASLMQLTSASSIDLSAGGSSSFITSAGSLTLNASAATGQVIITSAGAVVDDYTIQMLATNATVGAGGNILISANGALIPGAPDNFPSIKIAATDPAGQVLITSDSSSLVDPAIMLDATSADGVGGNVRIRTQGTSSSILIDSAGNVGDAITLHATGPTGGNINILADGNSTSENTISLNASSGSVLISASGPGQGPVDSPNFANLQSIRLESNDGGLDSRILLLSQGTSPTDAINLTAPVGGINIAAGAGGSVNIIADNGVSINTQPSAPINIGTTPGANVTIGGASSVTTIAGDLNIQGTTTTINTATLNVEDNIITINSGNGELGLDAGIIVRRFQQPVDAAAGDVVDDTANPSLPPSVPPVPVDKVIEEQGTCRVTAAITSPTTQIQLDDYASPTPGAYVGWWIKVTSAGPITQVRRIKAYTGLPDKVATIYDTTDAGPPPPDPLHNPDGADWAPAPLDGDAYRLYSASYIATFYDESLDRWSITTAAVTPSAISGDTDLTTAVVAIQQYQDCAMGAVDIVPKYYRNTHGVASTAPGDGSIVFTIIGHTLAVDDKVKISNSSGFTPEITAGVYDVTAVSGDTFTIINAAGDATADNADASATINIMKSSVLRVNKIEPFDPEAGGISIPGVSATQDILIEEIDAGTEEPVDQITDLSGSYLVLVSDAINPDGASAVFSMSSSGNGGSVSRISSAPGAGGQRLDAVWRAGFVVAIKHAPANTTTGTAGNFYTYRVRVMSAL